jgi:hypothetical protein
LTSFDSDSAAAEFPWDGKEEPAGAGAGGVVRFVSSCSTIVLYFDSFILLRNPAIFFFYYWLMTLRCWLMFVRRLIVLLLVAKFVMGASEAQLGCFAVVYVLWQLLMRRLQSGGEAKKS